MEAFIANIFFVLLVAFVCGGFVPNLQLIRFGIQSNRSVVTPLSLASDNVWFVSFNSVVMLFRNVGMLDAHFLNVNPAVLSSDVNSCCTLIASSRVGVPLRRSST